MSDRMSDERLAELKRLLETADYKIYTHSKELVAGMEAEQAKVEELEADNTLLRPENLRDIFYWQEKYRVESDRIAELEQDFKDMRDFRDHWKAIAEKAQAKLERVEVQLNDTISYMEFLKNKLNEAFRDNSND